MGLTTSASLPELEVPASRDPSGLGLDPCRLDLDAPDSSSFDTEEELDDEDEEDDFDDEDFDDDFDDDFEDEWEEDDLDDEDDGDFSARLSDGDLGRSCNPPIDDK